MTLEIVNGRWRTTGRVGTKAHPVTTLPDNPEIGKRVGRGGGGQITGDLILRVCVLMVV